MLGNGTLKWLRLCSEPDGPPHDRLRWPDQTHISAKNFGQTRSRQSVKFGREIGNIFGPRGTIDDQIIQIRFAVRNTNQNMIYQPLRSSEGQMP